MRYLNLPFLLVSGVTMAAATGSDPKCTIGERNTFSLVGAFQLVVSSCLTLGGQRDIDSDLLACMAEVVSQKMGIERLNLDCYQCLIDGVQIINSIQLKTSRDACITDITSNACGVDFSSFIECTGGYDPTKAIIEAHCTSDNAIEFMKTSMYRKITTNCLDSSNYVSGNHTSLLRCVTSTIVNSGGNFTESNISGECALCWYELIASMAILPPKQRNACIADPTSDACVTDSLHKDMFLFHKCAGIHPVASDLRYLTETVTSNSATTTLTSVGTVVIAFIIFTTFV